MPRNLAAIVPPLIRAHGARGGADHGLLFGLCCLPCLWAAMACQVSITGRGSLMQQFWASLVAGLALLTWLIRATMKSHGTRQSTTLAAAGVAVALVAVASGAGGEPAPK